MTPWRMGDTLSFRMPSQSLSDITTKHAGDSAQSAGVRSMVRRRSPCSSSSMTRRGPPVGAHHFKDEYQVLLANSGEQAVELARRHPVSVVVSDILMTGMTGIDVLSTSRILTRPSKSSC